MISLSVYKDHIQQLFAVLERAAGRLDEVGIAYRLVGGKAVFFHVDAKNPIAARFTPDIDFAVSRRNIEAGRAALALVAATTRVHVISIEDLEPVPNSPAVRSLVNGITLSPVIGHTRDMDSVGPITPEMKEQFSPKLKARLQQVRSTE